MSEKTYSIVETFRTIQGEGNFAGTPALFIRFSSCNLWSGRDEDRYRDAVRHGAHCPRFCDTDFLPRLKMTRKEIFELVNKWDDDGGCLVVLTGGEPFLQIDKDLLEALYMSSGLTVQIETNGTLRLDAELSEYIKDAEHVWVTCSPKQAVEYMKIDPAIVAELKVVVPQYDPLEYQKWVEDAHHFVHLYVQPCAQTSKVGESIIDKDNMKRAADWVMAHPTWSISIQQHKILGME